MDKISFYLITIKIFQAQGGSGGRGGYGGGAAGRGGNGGEAAGRGGGGGGASGDSQCECGIPCVRRTVRKDGPNKVKYLLRYYK